MSQKNINFTAYKSDYLIYFFLLVSIFSYLQQRIFFFNWRIFLKIFFKKEIFLIIVLKYILYLKQIIFT